MRFLSKIVWSEGMYLGPHHFQAQNRWVEDSVHFTAEQLWYAPYGLVGLQLDAGALRNGTVAVQHARGIFADGLPFDMPESDLLPPPCEVGDRFPPSKTHLLVSLGVPVHRPDGQNFSTEPATSVATRFSEATEVMPDETTGHDDKPVRLGRKNIRLVFESEAADDLQLLPVARITRDGAGRYVYDETFIPPCVRITASDHLVYLLRRLVDILDEKCSSLRLQAPAGRFQAGMSARDVASFWFLHTVNTHTATLRHLLLSKRGHPEELFCEMARLAGALCTFGLEAHPRDLPQYDHAHLDVCFEALDQHIRRHLEIIVPTQTIAIPLVSTERYFYVGDVVDQRCLDRARWVLGVRSAAGDADIIQKTPQVVKVCSAKFVPELVRRALPGLELAHLPVPPSAISARVESQYFALSRTGPCWEHIVQTRRVGVYVPGDLPSPELELLVILDSK